MAQSQSERISSLRSFVRLSRHADSWLRVLYVIQVVGFLRVPRYPSAGNVDRVCGTHLWHPPTFHRSWALKRHNQRQIRMISPHSTYSLVLSNGGHFETFLETRKLKCGTIRFGEYLSLSWPLTHNERALKEEIISQHTRQFFIKNLRNYIVDRKRQANIALLQGRQDHNFFPLC